MHVLARSADKYRSIRLNSCAASFACSSDSNFEISLHVFDVFQEASIAAKIFILFILSSLYMPESVRRAYCCCICTLTPEEQFEKAGVTNTFGYASRSELISYSLLLICIEW